MECISTFYGVPLLIIRETPSSHHTQILPFFRHKVPVSYALREKFCTGLCVQQFTSFTGGYIIGAWELDR